MDTHISPARPRELLPCAEPLSTGMSGLPTLGSAVGDSGSKLLLGASIVDIHIKGEKIHSRDQSSSAMVGNAWN